MTGTEDASVCVQTERGALLGAVTVAWIACDGEGCDAYLLLPGDEGVVIAEAICERWETGNDRDLCPECAAKESGRG